MATARSIAMGSLNDLSRASLGRPLSEARRMSAIGAGRAVKPLAPDALEQRTSIKEKGAEGPRS